MFELSNAYLFIWISSSSSKLESYSEIVSSWQSICNQWKWILDMGTKDWKLGTSTQLSSLIFWDICIPLNLIVLAWVVAMVFGQEQHSKDFKWSLLTMFIFWLSVRIFRIYYSRTRSVWGPFINLYFASLSFPFIYIYHKQWPKNLVGCKAC